MGVFSLSGIAKSYVQSWFLIDLVSAAPSAEAAVSAAHGIVAHTDLSDTVRDHWITAAGEKRQQWCGSDAATRYFLAPRCVTGVEYLELAHPSLCAAAAAA